MKKITCIGLFLSFVSSLWAGTPGVSGVDSIILATVWLLLLIISFQKTLAYLRELISLKETSS